MTHKPGLLKDPWRTTNKKAAPIPAKKAAPPPPAVADEKFVRQYALVEVKKYGGFTLENGISPTDAILAVLRMCVENTAVLDTVLTEHGIVVARLETPPRKVDFFVQRDDGWTLAIPDAANRSQASIQLINALMSIQGDNALKPLLLKYKLQAYKL